MIFQHTHEWIFGASPHTGVPKTATSRIVKDAHEAFPFMYLVGQMNSIGGASIEPSDGIELVMDHDTNRTIYRVGNDYAVQPGRGKKAAGRIVITGIDRYDVRTISDAQARAEGFATKWQFLKVWASMHDSEFHRDWLGMADDSAEAIIPVVIQRRPVAKYDAWLLTFEPVSEVKP